MIPSLPGRGHGAISKRARHLKLSDGDPIPRHIPRTRWSPEEDERLKGLMKDGLSLPQARLYFPTRGLHSVKGRWDAHFAPGAQRPSRANVGKPYSPKEVTKVLEMRSANETMTHIAKELGRSRAGIAQLVAKHSSRETTSQPNPGQGRRNWTPEEDRTLNKLYWSNTPYHEIVKHIEGPSQHAIESRLRETVSKLRTRSGPSAKTLDLQARILELRREQKDWQEIGRMFPALRLSTLRDYCTRAAKRAQGPQAIEESSTHASQIEVKPIDYTRKP